MLVPEQINLYIAEQPEWQRKLMVRLRQLVHSVSEDVEETWRAHSPHFDHDGSPMLGLTASKTSVSVIFHKGSQIKSVRLPFEPTADDKPGRTLKFREATALNEAAFTDLVRKAITFNARTARSESEPDGKKTVLHAELEEVLRKDPSAWANWKTFSASCRREYSEWVSDGKKEETRKRRIAQALEMIREGMAKEEAHHPVKGS